MFVVVRGRLKVTLNTPDGREIVLSVLHPGDLAGEFEVLQRERQRTAGTVALEAAECRVISADQFLAFLTGHPQAALVLLDVIIRRILAADRRRTDSGSVDTVHRLARFLVEQVDRSEAAPGAEIDVDIPLTQDELASLIASSRVSVLRSLGDLRSRGLITTGRRKITIRDLDGLLCFAGDGPSAACPPVEMP